MQIGDTYEYKNVVTKEITAGALGSGGLDIFATPFHGAVFACAARTRAPSAQAPSSCAPFSCAPSACPTAARRPASIRSCASCVGPIVS